MNIQSSLAHLKTGRDFFSRNRNMIFFVAGFAFDALTLVRIDSTLDLVLQACYLAGVGLLIVYHERFERGFWSPSPKFAGVWRHEVEVLHFLFGGLLSAYMVFYMKSTSFSRSLIFLTLVLLLMVANEMPQLRRRTSTIRLGLFAFCSVSFLNYLLPVLIGRMGFLIFVLSWILSVAMTAVLVEKVAQTRVKADESIDLKRRARIYLSLSPAVVLITVMALYTAKLIPPVPLSMKYLGIYHDVQWSEGHYALTSLKPKWWLFWRDDDRPFVYRPGDQVHAFVRLFAPRRFKGEIHMRWRYKDPVKGWADRDRVRMAIKGGRSDGFRGYSRKENFELGTWHVEVETADGRVLGGQTFDVIADNSMTAERKWRSGKM